MQFTVHTVTIATTEAIKCGWYSEVGVCSVPLWLHQICWQTFRQCSARYTDMYLHHKTLTCVSKTRNLWLCNEHNTFKVCHRFSYDTKTLLPIAINIYTLCMKAVWPRFISNWVACQIRQCKICRMHMYICK